MPGQKADYPGGLPRQGPTESLYCVPRCKNPTVWGDPVSWYCTARMMGKGEFLQFVVLLPLHPLSVNFSDASLCVLGRAKLPCSIGQSTRLTCYLLFRQLMPFTYRAPIHLYYFSNFALLLQHADQQTSHKTHQLPKVTRLISRQEHIDSRHNGASQRLDGEFSHSNGPRSCLLTVPPDRYWRVHHGLRGRRRLWFR